MATLRPLPAVLGDLARAVKALQTEVLVCSKKLDSILAAEGGWVEE